MDAILGIKESASRVSRIWRLWLWLGLLSVLLGAAVVRLPLLAFGPLFALVVLVAYRLPVLTVAAYLVVSLLPLAMAERFLLTENPFALGWGINAADVVIGAMLSAVLLTVATRQNELRQLGWLFLAALPFAAWLVFEVIRNVPAHGLSAAGEFRFRYLPLFSAFYVAVFFRDERRRAHLLLVLTYGTAAGLLSLVIYEVFATGLAFGPSHRFLHSSGSLALAEAALLLLLAHRYFPLALSRPLTGALAGLTVLLVVLDGHRSVWLALFTCIVALLLLGEARFGNTLAVFMGSGLLLALLAIVLFRDSGELFGFFQERSLAFFDATKDPNARWRIIAWTAAVPSILREPWIGSGFGGYWTALVNPLTGESYAVFPHNYYIMTLVKTGLIGLLSYLLFVAVVLGKWWSELMRKVPERRYWLLLTGIALVTIHVYGIAYGLEPYSWLVLGAGLTVLTAGEPSVLS